MDFTALALTLAGFGILMFAISYRRHRHARDGSAVLHGLTGVVLVVSGALLFEVALNYSTYQAVQDTAPLAEITIVGEKKGFTATLVRIPGGDLQVFDLTGTHWQVSAGLLHWRRFLPLFGLTHDIRLDTLTSYNQPSDNGHNPAKIPPPATYGLSHEAGIKLWRWGSHQHGEKAWVQTRTIQSAPLPLKDGQRVQVYFKNGALVLKPIYQNAATTTTKPPLAPVLNDRARNLLRNSDLTVPDGGTQEQDTGAPPP